jgi:hypothetical protein
MRWNRLTAVDKSAVLFQAALAGSTAALVIWILTQPQRDLQCAAGVLLLVLIGAGVVIERFWSRERLITIRTIILSSYALFLGFGMISDAFRHDWHFNGAVILLTFGSLLCLLLGFTFHSGRGQDRPAAARTFSLTRDQLFKVALLFFALGFGFLLLEWRLYGHLQSYAAASAGPQQALQPKPYIHTFTQLSAPGLLLALILLRRGISFLRGCLLTCLSALTVAWYIFSGVRTNLAWLAIGFVLVWGEIPDRRGSRRIGGKVILFASLAAAAILALTALRTNWNFSRLRAGGGSRLWQQVEMGMDTFYQFRRTFEYFPRRENFLAGYSLYGIVINPMPRAVWPQKPIGFGRLASILYDHNPASTLGLSLPGELYANFGIAGCLIGMLLFGMLAAGTHRWYVGQRGEPCALVVYTLIAEYMWFGIRGDMLDAASPVFYQLCPFILCVLFVSAMNSRLRRRASRYLRAAGPEPFPAVKRRQLASCSLCCQRGSQNR